MKTSDDVKQIIPAEGWWACFSCINKSGKVWLDRLACWALMNDGAVLGMCECGGYIDFAENVGNFEGYVYAESIEEAEKKALIKFDS